MKFMLLLPTLLAMAAASCGVETASTAATAAALKQKELEAGRKTMNDAQQSIGQSMQKVEESAQKAADADKQ
jgi:hypothetical protein